MNASALSALWNKIIAQFSTKSEMVSAVNSRQGKLIPGDGITLSGNVISCDFGAEEEVVTVVLTTEIPDVSMENRELTVYFNGGVAPGKILVTDESGEAVMRVPKGWQYRIVFPEITGCLPVADVTHIAAIAQRSVEVEYLAAADYGERVEVVVTKSSSGTVAKVEGATVTVKYSGATETLTTDANGECVTYVPFGETYSVELEPITDWYVRNNALKRRFTAERAARVVLYALSPYESGVMIVCSNGDEYGLEDFENARIEGSVENADAKLIKIINSQLTAANGVFAIDIDMIRERTYGANQKWSDSNTQFNSIPLNGNSASALYYYDGYTASVLVQNEGDERGIGTPAFDQAMGVTRTVGERTLQGFLGSTGQWSQLWLNVKEVDAILQSVRPNGTYLLSTLTTNKWTCTQSSANAAYTWSSAVNTYGKSSTSAVVPFFAF